MGTKTKSFSSLMLGAPALSGQAGTLIAVLDAVLVNGFGAANVQTINVAGEVATVSFAAAQPYQVDSVALVAGATPAALNGEKRVLGLIANGFTFAAPGVPDGAATGAITSKVAPAGWVKLFAGANLAAYKPSAPEATGCVLRVDDSGTTVARVRGFETMTDVSTGVGLFPTVATYAAGLWWSKSSAASAAVRPWRIYADDRGFYWCPKPQDAAAESHAQYFGDVISLKSNDPYACVLRANASDRSGVANTTDDLMYSDTVLSVLGGYAARAPNALGGAVSCFNVLSAVPYSATYPGATGQMPYPSPVDNGLSVAPIACFHANGQRGWFPGIYASWQSCAAIMATDDAVTGTGAMAGRKLRALRTGALAAGAQQGMLFFDPVGDWR